MNIFLIGYRCTGKTTVGKALARRLGWPFVDTDRMIAATAGLLLYDMDGISDSEVLNELSQRRTGSGAGPARLAVEWAQLNPDALASRDIGIDEVQRAIQQSNVNLPTGKLYGSKQAFTVESTGQLTDQLRAVIEIIMSTRCQLPPKLISLEVAPSRQMAPCTMPVNGLAMRIE